jgi:hypothetical protein
MHSSESHTAGVPLASSSEVIRRIVERTDLDTFADRVLDSFWEQSGFQAIHPPRAAVREWVRWNLELVIRWLVEARPPTEAELEVFREHARARVADGTPPDIVPANFRLGARFAWGALAAAATDDERPALVESADLLFAYVDQVSRIYSDVYAAAAVEHASEEERGARALLERIARDETPLPEDQQLAQRIGFRLDRAARPFVIALPSGESDGYLELAALLRRRGALAASEGRRVVGLVGGRVARDGLGLAAGAVIAEGPPAIRGERGRSLEELRTLVEVALEHGHEGAVSLADYLPELLLRRSPRLAAAVRERVYGPLEPEHPELARTLELLVEHNFERGRTAAALPVHRNTLRERINRISEITGVDLEHSEGQGLAWLAWLARRDAPVRPSTSPTAPAAGDTSPPRRVYG